MNGGGPVTISVTSTFTVMCASPSNSDLCNETLQSELALDVDNSTDHTNLPEDQTVKTLTCVHKGAAEIIHDIDKIHQYRWISVGLGEPASLLAVREYDPDRTYSEWVHRWKPFPE